MPAEAVVVEKVLQYSWFFYIITQSPVYFKPGFVIISPGNRQSRSFNYSYKLYFFLGAFGALGGVGGNGGVGSSGVSFFIEGVGGGGGGGANAPQTSGNGIPVGGPKK